MAIATSAKAMMTTAPMIPSRGRSRVEAALLLPSGPGLMTIVSSAVSFSKGAMSIGSTSPFVVVSSMGVASSGTEPSRAMGSSALTVAAVIIKTRRSPPSVMSDFHLFSIFIFFTLNRVLSVNPYILNENVW